MADFYQILKNAISDTGAASAAERQVLYQRARAALDNQIANFDPPLPDEARQAQYDRLGDAIGRLEEEASIAVKGAGGIRVEEVAMPPGKPPTPRPAAEEAKPAEAVNGEVAQDAGPKAVAARAAKEAKAAAKPAGKTKPDKAGAKDAKASRTGLAGTPSSGKASRFGALAAGLVALALLGGGGWYLYQSGVLSDLMQGGEPEQQASLAPKKVTVEPIVPQDQQPTQPATAEPAPDAPPVAQTEPAQTEPPAAQPEPPTQTEPAPDTQVAQTQPQPAAPEQPTAADDPNKDQERVPQAGAAATSGAKASFVIEEPGTNGAPQETRLDGSATWEVTGTGNDATLQFHSSIPARGATFEMTMRKNSDQGLPASHVIEFVFSATGENPDGQVKSIPGMLMREKENEAGTPLRGAGAQIVPGQYLIGLSNAAPDVTHNLSAIAEGSWIAVPALMESGKRALFLVSKGESGKEAVGKALAEWGQAQ